MIRNFRSLEIWKRGRVLVKSIYSLTSQFPPNEKFGLVSQMNRAAVSVPSNIAEGCGRNHPKELMQFLNIAIGSLCEIETQLYLTIDLEFMATANVQPLITEVTEIRKMLNGFINSIK